MDMKRLLRFAHGYVIDAIKRESTAYTQMYGCVVMHEPCCRVGDVDFHVMRVLWFHFCFLLLLLSCSVFSIPLSSPDCVFSLLDCGRFTWSSRPFYARQKMPEEKDHGRREKKEKHHRNRHRKGHKEKVSSSLVEAAEEEEDWDANRERLERICQIPPNNICNDCNNNGTRWASVNHGVFLCIRCSGIHRSLGVHVSKIKSTNMDKWRATEVALMEAIGNQRGKSLYEARLPKGMKTLTGAESELTLKTFITQKYQEKAFALENVNEVLRQYYKQTRYGKQPRKHDTKDYKMVREQENAAKEGSASQQEDTMKALYGVNAEAISKKSRKTRPVHGIFGLVNVSPEEYDERRRELLAHFRTGELWPTTAAT
ncbi:hypothetical protein MOQ_003024 [Trypanosoma cruzi marinkellei]|uniref:Arf-GAP domain-containing protein n=1 Tax=Trypanosoma cruzi marinkellei TaxID=85056 RepID=K2N141_TRYCR|nr:hypothetical protein MOQ_003024 [Trypanosoma cruzi marinkellei]